ncbi:fumarylacetoacetate hydrolase family protein [Hyphomicrobium sp. CS1GBMeth3]|uniref:fumarylacetoacetate hydrolase family protein n=1 Tax=Hyphomicrobium sp. CS1GBMeth3 TaxID=1892845 RepID=UPI0009300329|nr:fumarylacetoacetate hydrolase family protein [Hyphomicrobium sp. CS1GBMeth3]
MKLVRFGPKGSEKPGLVDADGRIRDLSQHVPDINGETLAPDSLARLKALDPASLPLAPAGVRLGAPVSRPWSFLAIGLNYADHAKEAGLEVPSEPVIFNKLGNTVSGPLDDVIYPKNSNRLDWEIELAFVIGKRARYVEQKDAMDYVAGYTICNDVSERRFQMKRNGQWFKGKAAETLGPLGPWLVTPDEISDPSNLKMSLKVNGETKQQGSTATMIFSIPYLVSYITEFCVLEPGDVVTTGTPPGVGSVMKPPQYLVAGDVMELEIEGLGLQRQTVVPFTG